MAKENQISEAEWNVMEVVWQKDELSSLEIIYALESHNWSPQTIKSMLGRLVKKGVLNTKKIGNRFLYTAAVSREQAVKKQSNTFLSKLFHGNATELVSHFIQSGELNKKDIDELKRILDDTEK